MSIDAVVLEYLKVLLSAPVVIAGLVFLFRGEISAFIRRTHVLKGMGWELGGTQRERTEEQASQPVPPVSPPETKPLDLGTHLSAKDVAELRSYIDAERATARLWEYRYLHFYLAPATQSVLDWFAHVKTTTTSTFEAMWMHSIPIAEERRAIINALQLHVLIMIEGDKLTITPKGLEYANFNERQALRGTPVQ